MKSGYVDGFVLMIPKNKVAAYKKIASEASRVWKKFGALNYKECILDDANPGKSPFTFAKMTKAKRGETIWFSYVEYKSRAHRDAVNKKVMAHFADTYKDPADMPFDMKRMVYAGFKPVVSA